MPPLASDDRHPAMKTRARVVGEAGGYHHSDGTFELQALISNFEQAEMPALRAELNLPLLALSFFENGAVLQSKANQSPIGYLLVKNGMLSFDPSLDNTPRTIEDLQAHHLVSWIRATARAAGRDNSGRVTES
jgi:hypothetical protein